MDVDVHAVLERTKKIVGICQSVPGICKECEYLAGWAEVVEVLWMEGHSFDPDEVFHANCGSCKAIATFCATMLVKETG